MASYSRVLVDSAVEDLWFLGEPYMFNGEPIDARRFTACEPFGEPGQPLRLPILREGRPARLTFGAFDMPVVDQALGSSLAASAGSDIELVPAVSENGIQLLIANILPCIECIDESETVGDKWTERDGRPDRIGSYRTIVHLFIDPSRIDHDIFRVRGWRIALIVSDDFAEATGLAALEGIRLNPVTRT